MQRNAKVCMHLNHNDLELYVAFYDDTKFELLHISIAKKSTEVLNLWHHAMLCRSRLELAIDRVSCKEKCKTLKACRELRRSTGEEKVHHGTHMHFQTFLYLVITGL